MKQCRQIREREREGGIGVEEGRTWHVSLQAATVIGQCNTEKQQLQLY